MTPIIEFKDYSWRYRNTDDLALKELDLTIEQGSFAGVVGPNGAGKTTLAYSIDGLIPGQYHGIKHGEALVEGREVEDYAPAELQRAVGMVFSDPEAQFTAMTVEDELVFGMENLGLPIPEIQERLDWVTELVDLKPLLDKPPYEVSGGQKQRVALAAVLAMKPRILVLDEPTSMLDPLSTRRVFDVLKQLAQEHQHTVIVIEHDLEHLVPLADQMILLHEGELVFQAETRAFFERLELLLERKVLPPESMEFFYQLRRRGQYQGQLPHDLDRAAAELRRLLEIRRAQPRGGGDMI